MFDFFNLRLNVRMLFKFDIETDQCDQFIDRIVQNWNRNEFERRLDELRILIEQKTNLFKRKSSLRLTFVGKLKCKRILRERTVISLIETNESLGFQVPTVVNVSFRRNQRKKMASRLVHITIFFINHLIRNSIVLDVCVEVVV